MHQNSYHNINVLSAPSRFSWEPSLGIFAPSALWKRRISRDKLCIAYHEHFQGLVTLLASIIPRSLRPYFMPEMLMGLPSQSFLPGLKHKPFRVHCFCAVHFLSYRLASCETLRLSRNSRFEAFFLKPSCVLPEGINFWQRPYALPGLSSLRLELKQWTLRFLLFRGHSGYCPKALPEKPAIEYRLSKLCIASFEALLPLWCFSPFIIPKIRRFWILDYFFSCDTSKHHCRLIFH